MLTVLGSAMGEDEGGDLQREQWRRGADGLNFTYSLLELPMTSTL
jgi:hypothetical protein